MRLRSFGENSTWCRSGVHQTALPDGNPFSLDWTLTFYRTIWGLKAMHWEHAVGGDWYIGHLEAIAADLPLLEASLNR